MNEGGMNETGVTRTSGTTGSRVSLPAPSALVGMVVMGALTTALVTTSWSLLATLLSPHESTVPLVSTLATGVAFGLLVGIPQSIGRTTRWIPVGGGLVAAAIWLWLTGLRPIGLEVIHPWGVAGALAALPLAAWLTRYALRDLDLCDPTSDLAEVLFIRALRGFGFVFFVAIVAVPFWFMVVTSFKSRAAYLADPTDLTIELLRPVAEIFVGYREVLLTFDFWRYILNSSAVALATVLITLTLAVLGAYAVTRLRFPGRNLLSRSILLIYMFPAIVLVIPLYSVFTQLGLRDTLPSLLIVYPAMTIPVALYMLRSYFQTLPRDLEEAAMIDGCTRAEVIWRITLPLSVPALASVGLYVFMIAWNEFLFAFMFLDTPQIFTLSRGMVALDSQEVPRQFLMAGAVVVTVPIMVLFFWFEKYLVGGLTAGGVKG